MPEAVLPPGTPFTLQVTLEFVALVTAAVKLSELPSRTEAEAGETVTAMAGGGGGGGVPAVPLPQPVTVSAKIAANEDTRCGHWRGMSRNRSPVVFWENCVRGPMLQRKAGEWPAKSGAFETTVLPERRGRFSA